MNKGKDGKHFIEVKRYGAYTVLNDVVRTILLYINENEFLTF